MIVQKSYTCKDVGLGGAMMDENLFFFTKKDNSYMVHLKWILFHVCTDTYDVWILFCLLELGVY